MSFGNESSPAQGSNATEGATGTGRTRYQERNSGRLAREFQEICRRLARTTFDFVDRLPGGAAPEVLRLDP